MKGLVNGVRSWQHWGMRHYASVDLGADSGRVMLAALDEGRITLKEMGRFSNPHVPKGGSLRWDIPALERGILEGLKQIAAAGIQPVSVSCDSWGVDFGLLDGAGELLDPPYIYRDARTDGMPDKVFAKVPRKEVFAETGIQFMQINTLYQMAAALEQEPALMARAKTALMIGDLFNYRLGGRACGELSLASTSQIYNPSTHRWSEKLAGALGLPALLPDLVESGTVIGELSGAVSQATGLRGTKVVATCSHDTGCAVAAVPASGEDWAYLSCGTWSLMGVELAQPLINPEVAAANFTNEVGYGRSIRFLKNIVGLWLVQECRRQWRQDGQEYSFDQLSEAAQGSQPFHTLLNPDDPRFMAPGGMPAKIQAYAQETGQPVPSTPGEIIRCAMESLALKYRQTLLMVEKLTGRSIGKLHVVGGGSRDTLLCQFTSDAIERPVYAGPSEATALGNCLIQAICDGQLGGLAQLRSACKLSVPGVEYRPSGDKGWQKAAEKFNQLPDHA